MKVCILAPFKVLPPVSGAPRRVFEISTGLCKVGISVSLLHAGSSTLFQDRLRVIGFPALENLPMTRHFLWSVAFDTYLASINPALLQSLMHIFKKVKIDILQVEGPWSIFSGELARAITGKLSLVYDAHNLESISVRYSSSVPWIWPYATFMEQRAVENSDVILCVSDFDKTRMCRLYQLPSSKIFVVPNGVHNYCYRLNSGKQIRKRLDLGSDTKIVFFHGVLTWKPNVEAARTIIESIAPEVEKDHPEMVFLIAGPYPPQNLLEQAGRRRNVRILGFVPNIEEYICGADVCIAPLKTGSGTKVKILEYFAAGKPVVATLKAVEGMEIRHGREALLFDQIDEEFVHAIKAASTQDFSHNLGVKARAFAERFDWSVIATKLATVYEAVLDRNGN